MRLLITGASGLLGLNLALEYTHQQHTVIGQVSSHPLHGAPFQTIQTDLTVPGALETLLQTSHPEIVIHCAALANLEVCERDPQQAYRINADVPAQLAALCRKSGARLLHVSTDAVFDGVRGNYTEEDSPNPLSVYAHTKLAGEQAVAVANPHAIIARVNLFGFSLTGKRSLAEFFINNLSAGRQVNGFTDVYFCPLLVNRVADIFAAMLARDLHGLYHVFAADCLSKYRFGVEIAQQFGFDSGLINPISVNDSRLQAARAPNLTMNTQKLTTALESPPPYVRDMLQDLHRLWACGYPLRLQQYQINPSTGHL